MNKNVNSICAIIIMVLFCPSSIEAEEKYVWFSERSTTTSSGSQDRPQSPGVIPFECYEDNGAVTIYTNVTDPAKITVTDTDGNIVYEYYGCIFPSCSFDVPQGRILIIELQIWGAIYHGTIY